MLFYLQSRISPLPFSPSSPCPSLAQPSPPRSEVLVCAWLLPQQIVLRSICVSCSFYKIPNGISFCDYATLFSTDGHLGCFQFGGVRSKAVMNILTQLFMWTHPLIFVNICLAIKDAERRPKWLRVHQHVILSVC